MSDFQNMVGPTSKVKARSSLVDLNRKTWIVDKNYKYFLFNFNEYETVYHFMTQCSIMSRIMKYAFEVGNSILTSYNNILMGRIGVPYVNV